MILSIGKPVHRTWDHITIRVRWTSLTGRRFATLIMWYCYKKEFQMKFLVFLGTVRDSTPPKLGCLPVSAMIHVPKAQELFTADGSVQAPEDQDSWFDYFGRTFNQLIWWAQAAKEYRAQVDPHKLVRDFKTDPSERNAP